MRSKNGWLSCLLICIPAFMLAQQQLFREARMVSENDTLAYRILLPENFSKDQSYPLVLFLHGAGERGSDNTAQLMHGSSLFTDSENRSEFPAIVIFPQCPSDDYWSNASVDRSGQGVQLEFHPDKDPTTALRLVMELLDEQLQKSYVDKDRIYVAGLSMGGMGTFELLGRLPDTFAAAVPICGGGSTVVAEKYAEVPMWIFHGAKDDVVNPQYSLEMVAAILDAGGYPNFTLYENANHNSWDSAFAEPQFLNWLFSKNRSLLK